MDRLSSGYELQYTKDAEKFFRAHEKIRLKYEESIRRLMTGDSPETVDVKVVKGKYFDYYRIRIGKYRVIYTLINGRIIVIRTIAAGPRGDVYKSMNG